ncbi:hypothetical protein LOK49_LG07G02629 [Camellia lanceoleosa]|uniref:Uncharacterized protein n=1 Tax=Camellia lanceoleosa TaxID=1840588 RepID=A0ACC0GZN2_9ERIC|nr:hypothetical protein LOK49_LG07G02629 [Camellia lanceoleosa]
MEDRVTSDYGNTECNGEDIKNEMEKASAEVIEDNIDNQTDEIRNAEEHLEDPKPGMVFDSVDEDFEETENVHVTTSTTGFGVTRTHEGFTLDDFEETENVHVTTSTTGFGVTRTQEGFTLDHLNSILQVQLRFAILNLEWVGCGRRTKPRRIIQTLDLTIDAPPQRSSNSTAQLKKSSPANSSESVRKPSRFSGTVLEAAEAFDLSNKDKRSIENLQLQLAPRRVWMASSIHRGV